MIGVNFDNKPKFDPKKPFTPVEDKPAFDASKPFEAVEEPSKKKETLQSYMQGLHVSSTDGQIGQPKLTNPITQKPIKKVNPFDVPVDEETDKKARGVINDIMLSEDDKWEDPIKAIDDKLKSAKDIHEFATLNRAANIARQSMAGSGTTAKRIMRETNQWAADNQTMKMVENRAKKYDAAVAPLRGISDQYGDKTFLTKNALIKKEALENPSVKKDIEAMGIDINDPLLSYPGHLPNGRVGQILSKQLNDPEVLDYLQNENSELLPTFQEVQKNLLKDHPDFGANVVANKVSRAVQKSGFNNIDPIVNYYGENHKEFANQIAQSILNPEEKEIWDAKVADHQEDYMDAPSLVQGIGEAGKDFGKGILKTFTEPFTPTSETIRKKWEKEASNVSANPEGISKFMRDSGHALGLVASIGATGNVSGITNPATAGAAATALGFFGNELEAGKQKYPDSPVKAYTSAIINTGFYSALAYDIFPAAKVKSAFDKVRPEVDEIVGKLAGGKISQEVAKNELKGLAGKTIDFIGGTMTKNTRISAEMALGNVINQTFDKINMDEKTFAEHHAEGEALDVAKTAFLSNLAIAGLSKFGEIRKGNQIAQDIYYDAATNPKLYDRLIDEAVVNNPEMNPVELKSNLAYLSKVKQELDAKGITPQNQNRYLFESLRNRTLKGAEEKTTDETLSKKTKEEVKHSEEVMQGILEGKDPEDIVTTKDEKEAKETMKVESDRNKLEEKGHKVVDKLLEQTDENDKPLFKGVYRDIAKSDPIGFLEEVAQQAQGVDKEGKPLEGGPREKDMIPQYGADVINVAKEMFPAKKPSKISVILPDEVKKPETVIIKPKEDAIPEKNAIDLSEKDYGKSDSDKNDISEGSQAQRRLGNQTKTDYSPAETERRVQAFSNWVEAVSRNDSEAKRNSEKELFGEEIQERGVLSNNDNAGEGLRAQVGDGAKIGEEATNEGARPSQGRERLQQPSGQSSDINASRAQSSSLGNKKSNDKGLSDRERKEVVDKIQLLSSVSNVQEKSRIARSLLSMLRENKNDNTRRNEILNLITQNLIEDASISIGKSAKVFMGETPVDSGEMGARVPEPEKPAGTQITEQGKGQGENEEMRLTHADTEKIYQEAGLPERLETPRKKREQLEQEANAQLENGYDFDKVADAVMNGDYKFEDVDQFNFARKVADLKAQQKGLDVKSPEFDAIQDQIEKLSRASDVAGTIGGRYLQSRKTYVPVEETISDYMMREKEVNQNAPLTDNQKEQVQKEFNDISETEKAYQQKIAGLEAENAKLRAEQEIKKTASTAKKTKKTHEDFVKERKEIFASIKDKLAKSRGQASATVVPYAKELFEIAPDVAKLVKNLVEEGVTKLADVVKEVHGQLKEVIPDVTEKDVHDIIAGEYNQKRPTRNKLAQDLFDLKQEAKLANKLEQLESGKEPASEKKKIQRNQEISRLKEKLKPHEQLGAYKKRLSSKIQELEYKLKTGDFDAESAPKKEPLKLDKEAQDLKDKLIKLKQDREIRLLKQEYSNRSKADKIWDTTLQVLNVPRTIMASMDFSGLLRQGIFAGISHPRTALLAQKESFRQAFSQKRFDEWFYDVQKDPRYEGMKKAGLFIADPHDPKLTAKEEAFMGNLAEKIPVAGALIKGSERAYVGVLNKLRYDLFTRFAERYEADGRTMENSPEFYKELATYINNSTGRGNLGFFEAAAPVLNSLFFSPRLIASRVNLLTMPFTPRFWTKVPKEIRVMYAKDLLKFVGLGMAVLALAKLGGAEVEDDPRSTDFGKIKSGDTRWDIWGGFQPYVRLTAQIATGQKKSTTTSKIEELNGKGAFGQDRGDVFGRFGRGKLAPVPAMVLDFAKGRDISGQPVTVKSEAIKSLTPLIYQDVQQAMKDKGVSSLFTVGIPATFGVGVNTYKKK